MIYGGKEGGKNKRLEEDKGGDSKEKGHVDRAVFGGKRGASRIVSCWVFLLSLCH